MTFLLLFIEYIFQSIFIDKCVSLFIVLVLYCLPIFQLSNDIDIAVADARHQSRATCLRIEYFFGKKKQLFAKKVFQFLTKAHRDKNT